MGQHYRFLAAIQENGAISDDEVALIQQKLDEDNQLDADDVKLLVELYCHTPERSAGFDALFFSVLEQVFLTDGQITPSEEYYLLKMIYSDREIREPEREFLRRLRAQLPTRTDSFDELCERALAAPSQNWEVGGRAR